MEKASFVLLIILCVFVILYSSMTLAYVGHIAQKGLDGADKKWTAYRKWLIGISSVLLILSVVVLIVASVQFSKGEDRRVYAPGMSM